MAELWASIEAIWRDMLLAEALVSHVDLFSNCSNCRIILFTLRVFCFSSIAKLRFVNFFY